MALFDSIFRKPRPEPEPSAHRGYYALHDDWDDDEDCEHPSETQQADGSYTCDDCGTITYDISDQEFAHQQGGNFSSSDFQGW